MRVEVVYASLSNPELTPALYQRLPLRSILELDTRVIIYVPGSNRSEKFMEVGTDSEPDLCPIAIAVDWFELYLCGNVSGLSVLPVPDADKGGKTPFCSDSSGLVPQVHYRRLRRFIRYRSPHGPFNVP